jgi:hypothetical protein
MGRLGVWCSYALTSAHCGWGHFLGLAAQAKIVLRFAPVFSALTKYRITAYRHRRRIDVSTYRRIGVSASSAHRLIGFVGVP